MTLKKGKILLSSQIMINNPMKLSFKFIFAIVLLLSGLVVSVKSYARCMLDVSDYVGWQIIYEGTVTGYVDEEGKEVDVFDGCVYGRILIVDSIYQVTCAEYSYSYSYRPDIVLISNGISLEACIDGDMYDIREW